ncbi:hypothetical protein TrRE_jg12695, partial [Triparma retinervis]
MNDYLANTCKTTYLAGDSPTISDCKWTYFAMMSNMLGLFFTGRSLIKKSHTALYSYLERFYKSPLMQSVQGYEHVPPSSNCLLLKDKLSKFGFDRKPLLVDCADIPIDCLYRYRQLEGARDSKGQAEAVRAARAKAKGAEATGGGKGLGELLEALGMIKFKGKLDENDVQGIEAAMELVEEDLTDEVIGMK